ERIRRAQDCFWRVTAFVPDQLVRRRRGESVVGKEPLRSETVVLPDRTEHISVRHEIPRERTFHLVLKRRGEGASDHDAAFAICCRRLPPGPAPRTWASFPRVISCSFRLRSQNIPSCRRCSTVTVGAAGVAVGNVLARFVLERG